jgi:hypothetical protein
VREHLALLNTIAKPHLKPRADLESAVEYVLPPHRFKAQCARPQHRRKCGCFIPVLTPEHFSDSDGRNHDIQSQIHCDQCDRYTDHFLEAFQENGTQNGE